QHVAHANPMQHRRQDHDNAHALQGGRVPILRLDQIHHGLRQRAIVADAAGEYDVDVSDGAFVHEAAGEESLLDGRADPAGPADRVDGADVMAMAAFDSDAAVEVDPERGPVERVFQVVDGERIAGEQHLYVTATNQVGEVLRAAG